MQYSLHIWLLLQVVEELGRMGPYPKACLVHYCAGHLPLPGVAGLWICSPFPGTLFRVHRTPYTPFPMEVTGLPRLLKPLIHHM